MYFIYGWSWFVSVTTAMLAVGSQCGPRQVPSAPHRGLLEFPDDFYVNWANTNSLLLLVFLRIVQFHFLYLLPVFVSSYWELPAFTTFSYKETVRNLWFYIHWAGDGWGVTDVSYTGQHWRIRTAATDSNRWLLIGAACLASCSKCLGFSSRPGVYHDWRAKGRFVNLLRPSRKMHGYWLETGRCCCLLHPFKFTAHAASFIHVVVTHRLSKP
jgi:hypothetical protein